MLSVVGLVHADRSVTGRYNLRLADDAVRVARLSSTDAPHGWLTLHVGGRFLLETEKSVRHGDYRVEGDRLTLRDENGEEFRGQVDDESVTLEGLVFERPGAHRKAESAERAVVVPIVPVRESPIDVPVSRREVLVERTLPAAERPVPRVAAPRFTARDFSGVWTVWQDGIERKDQRMEFREDGTFHFGMKGATSEGTWTVERDRIVLLYTKADGQPLDDGTSGRKEIPFAGDASAFRIDTFRYERATDR